MDPKGVLDALQSIAVLVAALTAIYGINAWRREFIGKRRIDLAEEVLARLYEARDVIRLIRNPFSSIGEGASRQVGPHESETETSALNQAYVVFERYNRHREFFGQLFSLRYRVRAQLGPEAAAPFDDLQSVINELFMSARRLGQLWQDQGRRQWPSEKEQQRHLEEMRRHEAVLWEVPGPDPISRRVDSLVQRFEATRQEVAARERPWWHSLKWPKP